MEVWSGRITNVSGVSGSVLDDIRLVPQSKRAPQYKPLPSLPLDFLAFVTPELIPLHLISGPALLVSSPQGNRQWLQRILLEGAPLVQLGEDGPQKRWNDAGLPQSTIGLLARVPADAAENASEDAQEKSVDRPGGPICRVTEVLFFAALVSTQNGPADQSDGILTEVKNATYLDDSKSIAVYALPLSSEKLYQGQLHRPPTPPLDTQPFIISNTPDPALSNSTTLDTKDDKDRDITDSAKKRVHLTDLFAEDEERRKRSRQKGGVSIGHAASLHRHAQVKIEPVDHLEEDVQVLSTRQLHYSRVKTEEPADTPLAAAKQPKRAILSSVPKSASQSKSSHPEHSPSASFNDATLDSRNKQIVSRTVMACMRLHGLEQHTRAQPRSQKSVGTAPVDSAPADTAGSNGDQEKKDEEYKLIYHQTYKGTLFTFRHVSSQRLIQADEARTVAHQLLEVFCGGPALDTHPQG